ncbi:MAG TPA: STAS domain-containing protein [Ferruginibacter sp.]|nr:STAS domain-containing protein [Ferruginibacter sp.]HRE64837.1 STAS domain-containing protein [Ferruginibacter sp.]
MNVKTDTKERFSVVTPEEATISANMTEELQQLLMAFLQKDIPHVVLQMQNVNNIDEDIANCIANVQQQFYEQNASFVVCELRPEVETILDKMELLDTMNITPTQSEAWDIVQMEEIERELLDDFEEGEQS